MLQKAIDFFRWARPWRERFGTVAGLRVALALRRAIWSAPANSTVTVQVRDLPRPIRLRAGTSDAEVFIQVFGDRQADFPVFGDPAVIVDAGANIGLTAIVLATRFPLAKVLALEVDRRNFSVLEENIRGYANIQPMLKGLWSKKTNIQITNPQADSWAFQTSEAQGNGQPSIEALGVQDILCHFGYPKIDLLKIDIEGGEYEVFRDGVEDWIDSIGMIAVEVHDRFRPGCTEAIRRALEPHGFVESPWSEYLLFRRKRG
jgi:FkbM family methyltransferase